MKAALPTDIRSRFFSNIGGDFIGGLTAAVVALPIALAFGVSSGLGAAAGLYGAIATGIIAAMFGGTPGQVTGPTGPMTVVVTAMFAAYPDHPHLIFASVFAAGLLQILFGKVKAGQILHYIPYPVISGFMSGIGTIIIILQLRPFVGLPSIGDVLSAVQAGLELFQKPSLQAVIVGVVTLIVIYLLPRIWRNAPAVLLALLAGTAVQQFMHFDTPTIGNIPSGLPLPTIPMFHFSDLHVVLSNAFSLAVLGSIDSLLTSIVMDKKMKTQHDSDQELIGQGMGNMAAALIGGLPGAGATMRSLVNVKSGGKTQLSGVIHGFLLLFVLLGMGKYAAQIPLSCLAAILISVGISILDYRGLRSIRKAPREDVIVMLVVYALTVFVDLIIAVGVGVVLACTLFTKKLSDAKLAQIGGIDTLEHLHEVSHHLPQSLREQIIIYTFNGPLFFGEVKNFTDSIEKLSKAKYVILRFSNVPMIDQTGAYALEEAVEHWEQEGIKILFSGMNPGIRQTLEDVGVIHKIEMQNCFTHSEEAIEAIVDFESHSKGSDEQIEAAI